MAARDPSTKAVSTLESWLAPRWSRASTLARPTQSAAAIRVPDRIGAQMAMAFPSAAPKLFVHEGARQSLERRLASFTGRPVNLSITDNRHAIISHAIKHGVLHARIHHMFLDAPTRVVDALVRYVAGGDRDASNLVGQFIDANGGRLARRRPRAIPLVARGAVHDLYAIFQDLNQRYFDGNCHALITWGRKAKRDTSTPRRAIRLGSYSSLERLIRIHPALDRAWVPRYFVAFVVYHEMLHHMIPAARGLTRAPSRSASASRQTGQSARRVLHPPELLERERLFRKYERALDWERRHIGRLLRSS